MDVVDSTCAIEVEEVVSTATLVVLAACDAANAEATDAADTEEREDAWATADTDAIYA